MRKERRAGLILAAAVIAIAGACGGGGEKAAADSAAAALAAPAALFDRLGGRGAIVSVVDTFVANVAGDARINKRFARVAGDAAALSQFKGKLVDQICQATGGPCTYTGLDMKTAHQGMNLTDGDFDALVEDLVKSLDAHKVPQAEKDELLGMLGPMRADIVTKK